MKIETPLWDEARYLGSILTVAAGSGELSFHFDAFDMVQRIEYRNETMHVVTELPPPAVLPQATYRTGRKRLTSKRKVDEIVKSGTFTRSGEITLCVPGGSFCVTTGGSIGGDWKVTFRKWEQQEQWEVCQTGTIGDDLDAGGSTHCFWQTVQTFTWWTARVSLF